VDGDTIKCRLARSVRTIRLVGLDTPELHIACERARALDAQAAMNGLLKSGRIAVREFRVMSRDVPGIPQPSLDRYGRRLAEVSVAGQDVVKAMIASGKGRPYDGGTRGPWSGC
jgi:endonuclease YncB( thermonuclease family)